MSPITKPQSPLRAFILAGPLAALLSQLAAPSASAATYYWDNNGTTAGFGTAAGTWAAPTTGSATQGWSTNTGGTVVPGTVTTALADTLNFGNGSTGLAAGTITVSGAVAAGNIIFASGSGAISVQTGTINLAASETITVNNATDTISAILSGAATGFTKAGTGSLRLSGVNTYTGPMTISAGSLALGNAAALGTSSSVTVASGAALNPSAITATFTAPLTITGTGVAGGGALETIGGSGTTNWNGAVTLNGNALIHSDGSTTLNIGGAISLGANTLTVTTDGSSTDTFSNVISDSGGITKNGGATLVLSGPNTYSGATTLNAGTLVISGSPTGNSAVTLNGGTLQLNYTTNNTSKINNSAILTLGGGTLDLKGGSHTEIVASTTLTPGATNVTSSTAGSLLAMGDITHNAGSAINFGSNVASTSTANTNGILGGWATVGGITWAVGNGAGSAITGLAAYTLTSAAATSAANYAGAHIDVDNTAGLIDGVITPSTLRFNTATATTMTLAAGTNSISAGGILVTAAVGNNLSTIAGGDLTGPASGDLTFIQNNTSNGLKIASVIVDNTATTLTKAGNGTVTLTGINTYTGNTTVAAGTLEIGEAGQLGAGTYSGNIAISSGATFRYNSSANQILQTGVVSGAGSLVKDGLGTLTLSGINTYTGPTTIAAGVLEVGGAGQLNSRTYSGAISIATAATLNYNSSANQTLSGIISGAGGLTKSNTNALTLSGANTYTGLTVVDSGTLLIASATALGASASGTFVSPGATLRSLTTLTVTGEALTLSGAGDGSIGALNVGGNKTLTWGGPITLATDTTIHADGGSAFSFNSAAPVNLGGSTLTVDLGGSTASTFAGVISNGNLTKSLTSTLNLNAANTYSGTTTISGGILQLGNVNALQNTSGISMASGTTLRPTILGVTVTAPITIAGTVTIGTPTTNGTGDQTFKEFILNGVIGGTGDVTFSSSLNVNTPQTVTLGAAATYSGNTKFDTSGGTASQIFVKLGTNNALPTTTVLTIDGQTGAGTGRGADLNLNGFNQTLAGLTNTPRSLRVTRIVNSDVSAAATLTINNTNDYTFTGTLGGNGGPGGFSVNPTAMPGSTNGNNFALIKDGSGAMTLAPTSTLTTAAPPVLIVYNTYIGGTTVLNGTLNFSGVQAQPSTGTVAVSAGATVNLSNLGVDTTTPTVAITGAGNFNMILTGGFTVQNQANYDMSAFTGIMDISGAGGRLTMNSPFVSPATGAKIIVEDGTTAYLGFLSATPTTLLCIVQLNGTTDDGENLGQLRVENSAHQNGPVILNANSTIGSTSGTGTIAGVISDGGSGYGFTKQGNGTLTLSANNTYTGVTNVSAGTLNINGTLGAGANVVSANGGVTNIGVNETLAALNIANGAVVTLGASSPALPPEGLNPAAVPEPGSLGLLVIGVLGLLGRRRRV